MSSAMLLAKQGREKQMKVLEEYLAGGPVVFKSHQGQNKDFEATYDPSVYEKERSPIKTKFDDTAKFLDAAANVDAEAVSNMLESNIDPNLTNADGLTALHQACIEGSLKVASLLIQHEADINRTDNDWWTPLHAASACDHWRVVNLLLGKGAHVDVVNVDGDLPVDVTEDDKTRSILEAEMERRDLTGEARDELVDRPEHEFNEAISKLIEDGAHNDYRGARGESLLHIAASNGWVDATKTLIDAGVPVNTIDDEQDTPLHLASFFSHYKVVEMLGEAGAKVTAINRFRDNCLMMTEDPTMERLLKAIQNNQKVAANEAESGVQRRRAGSSVKRKSMFDKNLLMKADIEAEQKTAMEFAALLNQDDDEEQPRSSKSPETMDVNGAVSPLLEAQFKASGGYDAAKRSGSVVGSNEGYSKPSDDDGDVPALSEVVNKQKVKAKKEKQGGCCVLQ